MKYIDVVVDNKSEYTDSFFTYKADDNIEIGDKVIVPFSKRKQGIEGYVVDIDTIPQISEDKIKHIISIDKKRSLTKEIIDTAMWLRSRYGVKYIDAIKMFTVSGKRENKTKILPEVKSCQDNFVLTKQQRTVIDTINLSINDKLAKTFLLHGVTNSGKTEVYMQTVAESLKNGRSAIVLVPEIALAGQTAKRFKERFGDEKVAIMHSKLKTSERLEQWLRVREGKAQIVIGARTAIFAPLENIGVIVIDEEHESTYKSDHNPKYETVDVAYKRSVSHKATLILGSATPSVVSYKRAEDGLYKLLEMNERIGSSELPEINVVDMKEEVRDGNTNIISRELLSDIDKTIKNDEQVILFLNRRGFSTQVMCSNCGYHMTCPDCEISLTYHKKENAAICHYCGRKFPVPHKCPSCEEDKLQFVGTGTERLEENICKLLPDVNVDRFDLDTAKNQTDINKVLKKFRTKKTDILVGTQILAKGLDFKNVGLVGIVLADMSLNIPDYRSAERTFQLITQVSGRAGRASYKKGKSRVILQTFEPDDQAIIAAAKSDYSMFYENELLFRKLMNYPPYSDIISVSFVEKKGVRHSYNETYNYAQDFRNYILNMKNAPSNAVIYAPRYDFFKGGAEKNKVYFYIKAPKGTRSGYIKAYMDYRKLMIKNKSKSHIEIDVNPYGMI